MTTHFFKQTHFDQIFCRFTVHKDSTTDPRPKIPLKAIPLRPILWLIGEKIATSLHNDNFFSNKHILTKSFEDSQFIKTLQLILDQKSQKKLYHYDLFYDWSERKLPLLYIMTTLFSNIYNLTKSFADSQFIRLYNWSSTKNPRKNYTSTT